MTVEVSYIEDVLSESIWIFDAHFCEGHNALLFGYLAVMVGIKSLKNSAMFKPLLTHYYFILNELHRCFLNLELGIELS